MVVGKSTRAFLKLLALGLCLLAGVSQAVTTCYYTQVNNSGGGSWPDYQIISSYQSNTFSSGDNLCAHPNAFTQQGDQFETPGTNPTGGWGQMAAWLDNNRGLNHDALREFVVVAPFPTYNVTNGVGSCSAVTYIYKGTKHTGVTGAIVLTTTAFTDCEDPVSNPAQDIPLKKKGWW